MWNAIDTYLSTHLLADLGAAGAYVTLQIKSVNNTDQWTPDGWALPAITFNGSDMQVEARVHMDGRMHHDNLYPYVLAAVTAADTQATARQQAKTMAMRLQAFARDHYTVGGVAVGGEVVTYLQLMNVEILVFPIKASKIRFYGIARAEINIYSAI